MNYKLSIVVALLLLPSVVMAGNLKNFESGVSQTKSTSPSSSSSSSSSNRASSSDSDSPAISLLGVILDLAFISSTSRQQSPETARPIRGNIQGSSLREINQNLRRAHSFAMPNLRVDGLYHYAMDGVQAMHLRGEAGFLMLGADVDFSRYYENSDRLNNLATHGLIRFPLGSDFFELDLALGYRRIWGDQVHQGFDFGLPFYINIGQYVQLNLNSYFTYIGKRPVQDYNIGASFKYKLGGIHAGYRSVDASGNTLHGPEVGLFFQW